MEVGLSVARLARCYEWGRNRSDRGCGLFAIKLISREESVVMRIIVYMKYFVSNSRIPAVFQIYRKVTILPYGSAQLSMRFQNRLRQGAKTPRSPMFRSGSEHRCECQSNGVQVLTI